MVDLKITLPEHFLDEEVRCDYLVSHEMKEVWAVELDLLAELDRVCKKYGIEYFAESGTLLGAVRHKGFIPWDDDIDVSMTRDNYDKLCAVAAKEFSEPYFLQTEYSDRGSLRGHAQLRNSKTTGILSGELQYKYKFNQGIFLDIFPFDNVPDDLNERKRFIKKLDRIRRISNFFGSISSRYSHRSGIKGLIRAVLYPLFKNAKNPWYRKLEKEAQKYNKQPTKQFRMIAYKSALTALFYEKKDFEELVEVPFEMLTIPIPKDYENVLSTMYGKNWKTPIQSGSAHGGVIFDVNKSYSEYLTENK